MSVNHIALAEQLLGSTLDLDPPREGHIIGYGPCPGAHRHTTPSKPRDFRIIFDADFREMPHEHCFHASCASERDAFIRALGKAIRAAERAENGGKPLPRPKQVERPAAAPKTEKPVFSAEAAREIMARCPRIITEDLLRRISPVEIPEDRRRWGELLIDTLYQPGERILVFTDMCSQGQYLRIAGKGNYRLASRPGTRAEPCEALPSQGAQGCWYLCAPVHGTWLPNPNNIDRATREPKLGRRHAECCTAFRYAVIESDTLPPSHWLQILAMLEDRITAVYTSGSKSVHSLIYLGELHTPAEFNIHRQQLLRRLVPVGADPAALTPVRLTRLPGALRLNKREADGTPALQRLLYLNPNPQPHTPLHTMPCLR